jgi:hypothetical protein
MTGYYGYTYLSLRNSENIAPQIKRGILAGLVFAAFITAIKVWVLLGGFEFMTQSH